jgi:hypothetical protein
MSGFSELDPIVVFDETVAAGAGTVTGPVIRHPNHDIVWYQASHSGLGAAAAGSFQYSVDGVNWSAATGGPTLTSSTPFTSVGQLSNMARFLRYVLTHGGANGGQVVIVIRPLISAM